MRISERHRYRGAAGLLLLSACSGKDPAEPAAGGEPIACAVAGAEAFTTDCRLERSRKGGIETLVLRHPDGAFRRIEVREGGRGLAVADGAAQAVTRSIAGMAEVAVDSDRYRLPLGAGAGADSR